MINAKTIMNTSVTLFTVKTNVNIMLAVIEYSSHLKGDLPS